MNVGSSQCFKSSGFMRQTLTSQTLNKQFQNYYCISKENGPNNACCDVIINHLRYKSTDDASMFLAYMPNGYSLSPNKLVMYNLCACCGVQIDSLNFKALKFLKLTYKEFTLNLVTNFDTINALPTRILSEVRTHGYRLHIT